MTADKSACQLPDWAKTRPVSATSRKRGEEHPRAIFTDQQVVEIRAAYRIGSWTIKELATHWNVRYDTMRSIIIRRTWKHLP